MSSTTIIQHSFTLHDHHCYAKKFCRVSQFTMGSKYLWRNIFSHTFFFWKCLPFSWFITTNLLFCFMKNFAKRVILLKMFSIHCTIPFRVQSWIVTGVPCQETCSFHLGGFQLEFVSISRVINHMTCYKFECSHWLKLQHSD